MRDISGEKKVVVVVTNYPKEIKAFYMRLDEDGKTVSAMDILVPKIGEEEEEEEGRVFGCCLPGTIHMG